MPVGQVFSFDTVIPQCQFVRTSFYNEWWHPQGLDHVLGMNLVANNQLSAVVTIYRPDSRNDFDNDDRRRFSSLLLNLVRAIEIRQCVAVSHSVELGFRDALNLVGKAGVVVDSNGRLLFCNRIGEQLLSEHPFTLSGSGGVVAGSAANTAALRRLIALATGSNAKSNCMFISRDGKKALIARVVPLPGAQSAYAKPRALILLDNPQITSFSSMPSQILQREHQLAAAEAVIAVQISSGETLKEYADRTGITHATARTHLARVFDKMGIHRQSELIRLVIKSGLEVAESS